MQWKREEGGFLFPASKEGSGSYSGSEPVRDASGLLEMVRDILYDDDGGREGGVSGHTIHPQASE